MKSKKPILFFDGVCGLCNQTIDFFILKDKSKTFRYSPLQGKTAKEFLGEEYTQDLNTVVLYLDGHIYIKSKAIFKSLTFLGFPYSMLKVLLIIPSFILDFFYNIVAKFRYRIFGKSETCRFPTKEERDLFLD